MSALENFLRWTRGTAIPFWADRGFDQSKGLFEEALDFSGNAMQLPHRAMVQARQIYVFARAASLGWYDRGSRLAEQAMAKLIDSFCVDHGGRTAVVFAVHRDGSVASPKLDAYTHAFVLFALAWYYRLSGERDILDLADRVHAFVMEDLTDFVHEGLLDSIGAAYAEKRQNPLMHLLEAYLALEEAAPGRGYLQQAAALVDLFTRRIVRNKVIIEYFDYDWRINSSSLRSDCWEPGHHYEWAWLLQRHSKLSSTRVPDQVQSLISTAKQYGHSTSGLIYDELSSDMIVVGSHHRLWPHTEALKAALLRDSDDEAISLIFAETMAEQLSTRFLGSPFAGGWIDRIDAAGTPLTDRVPASSLYHLMLAATEAASAIPTFEREAEPI